MAVLPVPTTWNRSFMDAAFVVHQPCWIFQLCSYEYAVMNVSHTWSFTSSLTYPVGNLALVHQVRMSRGVLLIGEVSEVNRHWFTFFQEKSHNATDAGTLTESKMNWRSPAMWSLEYMIWHSTETCIKVWSIGKGYPFSLWCGILGLLGVAKVTCSLLWVIKTFNKGWAVQR